MLFFNSCTAPAKLPARTCGCSVLGVIAPFAQSPASCMYPVQKPPDQHPSQQATLVEVSHSWSPAPATHTSRSQSPNTSPLYCTQCPYEHLLVKIKLNRDFLPLCITSEPVPSAVSSPDQWLGQWESHSSIHARLSLEEEAFGYLKRVIVTPSVDPRFLEFLHLDLQSTEHNSLSVITPLAPSESFVFRRQLHSTSASSLSCVPQTGHNVFSHFSHRLFPLHPPLLSKSRLVSCPVRRYMLKFRTFSCLTWGVCSTWSVHFCASFSTHTRLSIRVMSIFLPGLFEISLSTPHAHQNHLLLFFMLLRSLTASTLNITAAHPQSAHLWTQTQRFPWVQCAFDQSIIHNAGIRILCRSGSSLASRSSAAGKYDWYVCARRRWVSATLRNKRARRSN